VALAISGFSLTGLIGLRYYTVPLLILLVYPLLASNVSELRHFMRGYSLLCMVVCLLGIVQFSSPVDSLINRYSWAPNSDIDVATFGEIADRAGWSFVRITGTFSYISPYASYLQFMFFCSIAMFLTSVSERERLWYLILTGAVLSNLFMTGSRGPVLGCLVLSLIFASSLRRALGGKFGFVGVFLGLMGAAVAIWLLADVAQALIQRNAIAGDSEQRVSATLLSPWYTVTNSDFWGNGLGATFLGLGQLTGTGGFEYTFDEVTQDRLAVEVGILGYLFFVVFKAYFAIATFRLALKAKNPNIKIWLLVSFGYQASLAWSIPLYNSVAAIYYFFSLALFVWLRRLQSQIDAAASSRSSWRGTAAPRVAPR
jgi:hypothetical protein